MADYQKILLEKDNDVIQTVESQIEATLGQARASLSAEQAQELLKDKFPASAQANNVSQNGDAVFNPSEDTSEGLSE